MLRYFQTRKLRRLSKRLDTILELGRQEQADRKVIRQMFPTISAYWEGTLYLCFHADVNQLGIVRSLMDMGYGIGEAVERVTYIRKDPDHWWG